MKKWLPRILFSSLAVILIVLLGFISYAQFAYEPSGVLAETVDVSTIKEDGQGLIFQPESPNGKGIILYQGAKVEEQAYAYLGQSLSEQGFVVSIPTLPLNFAILNSNVAKEVIEEHEEVEEWVLGGHSLGGVAASFYAEHPSSKLKGLFFLGAYPASDFSTSDLAMLSIYGEQDGLTTLEDIEKSRSQFSHDATFVEIKGGNHAQFGLYGDQKGDDQAEIEPLEQQHQVIEALIKWINKN